MAQQQTSHKHHFNPRLLLAGFTDDGTPSGHLWEFDGMTGKRYRKRPKGVAWVSDYYTVEIPGQAPDVVETAISRVESRVAPILRSIVTSGSMPIGGDHFVLMEFLALLYARGPAWRHWVTSMTEQLMRLMLRVMTPSEERWERVNRNMVRDGYPPMQVSREELKQFAERDKPILSEERGDYHARTMNDAMTWLPELLSLRNWCVVKVSESDERFITADTPVSLVWMDPLVPSDRSPGLAVPKTEIAIPIHAEVALVASFEPLPPRAKPLPGGVREINRRTALHATRRIYGRESDFAWSNGDRKWLAAADWFAWFLSERKSSQ